MAGQWFVAHDEDRTGPYSDRQLRDLADAGKILPTDTVWKEGVAQGVAAAKVKNLFDPAASIATAVSTGVPAGSAAPSSPPASPPVPPTPEAADPGRAIAPGEAAPATSVAGAAAKPQEAEPAPAGQPGPPAPQARKVRAVAGRGAIIVGQDGAFVKLKKKCLNCGHEDSSRTTLPIRNGLNKTTFFCRKCRKVREVEFQGLVN
jgi:hypothetical protein